MTSKTKNILPWILGTYLTLSWAMLSEFRYVIAPDVTSYISIAQKYLHGDFSQAINGHWSPLVSWLMVPLLAVNMRPLLAIDLQAIVAGCITLVGIDLLMSELDIRGNVRILFLFAMVPLITFYAMTAGNPDLLCLCILIFYLYLMISEGFRTSRFRGIAVGFLAGLAYLAKSYNFYFFLLHFTCVVGLIYYGAATRSQRKMVLSNAFSGVVVFMLISSVWIALLSHKYHAFTVSTAGDYNFSYIRPGSPGHVVDTDGLLAPSNLTAYSAWEDPAYIPKVAWSPFNSALDFTYFLKNTAKNTAKYLFSLSRNPIFFFTIIYFALSLFPFRVELLTSKPFYLFLTLILHPIGYLMLLVEDRYVWLDYVLLYVLSAYIVSKVLNNFKIDKLKRIGVLAVPCGYIAIISIASLYYHIIAPSFIVNMKRIYFLSAEMNKYQSFKGENIASQTDNWSDDLCLTYYLDARYYGKVKEGITNNQLREELLKFKIEYYFVHGTLKNQLKILKPERKFGDITIYRVIPPSEAGKAKDASSTS